MFCIMWEIFFSVDGSREVVLAIRMGIPKTSPKVSQKASMFFLGMVCGAALR